MSINVCFQANFENLNPIITTDQMMNDRNHVGKEVLLTCQVFLLVVLCILPQKIVIVTGTSKIEFGTEGVKQNQKKIN